MFIIKYHIVKVITENRRGNQEWTPTTRDMRYRTKTKETEGAIKNNLI